MSITLFSVSIIAVLLTVICRQVYKGYKRGLSFMLIDLAVILFCALVGASVSGAIAGAFEPYVDQLVRETDFLVELSSSMPNFSKIINAVVMMILSLLLYVPVFLILRLISSFVIALLKLTLLRDKNKLGYTDENADLYVRSRKKGGALVGILSGFALTVILTMPLLSTVSVAGDIITVVENYSMGDTDEPETADADGEDGAEETPPELEELYRLRVYADDAPSVILRACGADMLFKIVARAEVEGEVTYLDKEIHALACFDLQGLMSVFEDFGSESETVTNIEELKNSMDDSLVIRLLAADVISSASSSWIKGESYLGVDRPSFGDDNIVAPFMDKLFELCATTNARTVSADVATLLNVCGMLDEVSGLLDSLDYDNLLVELSPEGVVGRIETELKANPHLAPLANVVHDMTMRTVVGSINSDGTDRDYDILLHNITESINDVLELRDDTVKVSTLTSDIQSYLESYSDTYVPEEVIEVLANTIMTELGDKDEVKVNDLRELLGTYLGSMEEEE